MINPDSTEEELTQSYFNVLLQHSLDVNVSKNLFKAKSSKLTSINLPETTTSPLFSPKNSPSSVFDRLITDSNRRASTALKLQDYRVMLEQEYENSLLSPVRISKESESNLVLRLITDSERRKNDKIAKEKLKTEENSTKCSVKHSAGKVKEVVNRLFVDKRKKIEKRNELKESKEEKEIAKLKEIREKIHPCRKVNQEAVLKIAQKSTTCKHVKNEAKAPRKSWNEVKLVVNRLYTKGGLRLSIPEGNSKTSISPLKSTRASLLRLDDLDKDDFLISLKARSKLPFPNNKS